MELAKHFDIQFLEVSAKNAINVDETFETMSKEILDKTIKSKAKGKGKGGKAPTFGGGNALEQEPQASRAGNVTIGGGAA